MSGSEKKKANRNTYVISSFSNSLIIHKENTKDALTAEFSLARLEIRSRNEEAINSTRNRIYSLKVFYFLLYRRRYFLFVSELIQYACQRRPEIRLRSQAIRLYKKIQGPRFQRIYIIARDQRSDLHGSSFQSSPKNKPHAHHKTICIQRKFTTPDHRSFVN